MKDTVQPLRIAFIHGKITLACVFAFLIVCSRISAQGPLIGKGMSTYSIKDTVLVDSLLDFSEDYYYEHSNFDSSVYWSSRALQIAKTINYKSGQRTASYILGLNYSSKNLADSALAYYEEAIEISNELNDTLWAAISFQAAGRSYSKTGRYKKALENYFESLQLRQSLGDSSRLSWPLNNIGTVYFRQKNFEKALEYYKKTYEIELKHSSSVEQASTLGNIGMIYQNLENFPEALHYLSRSYKMLDSLGEQCRLIYATLNLGSTYADLGQQEEAKKFFLISYEGGISCENQEAVSNALLGLGNGYMQEGSMKLAEKSLHEAYKIANENDLKATELEVSESLYEFYKSMEDYKTSLEFLEVHRTLKGEAFNEDMTEQITTLELNYEFELERDSLEYQKQAELLLINSELEEQRLYKFITIVGLLILAILVFVVYRNYRLKQVANLNLQKKNEIQEEKLKMEEEVRKKLEIENNQKARSLTASSLQLLNLNEKLSEIVDRINENKELNKDHRNKITRELNNLRNSDSQWDSIKLHFENVHPQFFERLEQYFPEITSNDHKILAFIKMKLSNKEIALILNVTRRAVEQSKRRLKKKLGMDAEDMDILGFIDKQILIEQD